jgi:hypothetical protein
MGIVVRKDPFGDGVTIGSDRTSQMHLVFTAREWAAHCADIVNGTYAGPVSGPEDDDDPDEGDGAGRRERSARGGPDDEDDQATDHDDEPVACDEAALNRARRLLIRTGRPGL